MHILMSIEIQNDIFVHIVWNKVGGILCWLYEPLKNIVNIVVDILFINV